MSHGSRRSIVLAVALLGAMCPSETDGIVIRHDRDDVRYRVPADRYPEVAGVGRAHGTLVHPRWVLTAAHVVDGGLSPFSGTVRVAGLDVPVRRIVLHPTWVGDLGPGLAEPDWIDMALVELVAPVDGVTPATPYSRADETGKEVVFVGSGRTGDGITGATRDSDVLRAATNVVARADRDWLRFDFDAPPDGTDLEGVSGPGDSGNGALLDVDGVRHVLGVGSRNEHLDRGLVECTYGTVEVYARVSTQREWIRRTTRTTAGPGSVRPLASGDWPDSPAGRAAREFFAAYNAGDPDTLRRFAEDRLTPERRRMVPPDAWARLWVEQRERTGPVRPVHLAAIRDNKLVVLAASAGHWRSYAFELLGSEPHLVREIGVRREHTLHGERLPAPAGFVTIDEESTDD